MRVEVYAPSGEMVFDSGAVTGQVIEWMMQNQKGEPVADGVYLATIQFKTASGQTRKRIEQIIVNREPRTRAQPDSPNAVAATITGSGTPGTIAKFDSVSTITDSVLTEDSGSVGISTQTPTAKLHISVTQPPASAGNGTTAKALLQTSGGKGGNTTGAGTQGGKGASISLFGGNGGNAVAGGTNGIGGSITLQPGSSGTGGGPPTPGGGDGNVLLAPTVGNVGIGTNTPTAKLVVKGKPEVDNDSVTGVSSFTNGGIAVSAFETGAGIGVVGISSSGTGVAGSSVTGYAGSFTGKARVTGNLEIGGNESFGSTTRQMLNLYNKSYGIGVQASTFYFRTNSSFNWYKGGTHTDASNDAGGGTRLMRLGSGGDLTVIGQMSATNFNETSDRHAKANFSSVNSRLVLTRLASIPIQTWNYKSESEAVRHIGPVAQDFRAAFNLGADDKHISTVDADGVALAAIQGLY